MQLQKIKNSKISADVMKKINGKKALSLDVACGAYKRQGAIGMDVRPLEGVDIVHDAHHYPWPIPDEVCMLVTANHFAEHIPKWGLPPQINDLAQLLVKKGVITKKELEANVGETQIFSFLMRFMDEAWRVSRVGGQMAMVMPYAGSIGFYQDPTHASPITEAVWFYFDPTHASKLFYIYKPKPWKIALNSYQTNGNIEVVLEKLPWKKEYDEAKYV